MSEVITIITPTFNRYINLKKLYKSLLLQTNKSFIWFIVDDGSTDVTCEYIKKIQKCTQIFKIKYMYQKNSGKHIAINNALKVINTELTFIVDSDDHLTPDAIETILKKYKSIPPIQKKELCGLSFLKMTSEGNLLLNKNYDEEEEANTYVNYRVLKNIKGDMAEVWITKILKKFQFPIFKNEKFLSEDVVWIKMSGPYKIYFFNKPIYIANYLSDGITKNRRKTNWNSPLGCIYKGEILMNPLFPIRLRIKGSLYYNIYNLRANKNIKEFVKKSKAKLIVLLTLIPSYIIYRYWKVKYSN